MDQYWVSAIVQNEGDKQAWLLSIYDSEPSLSMAIETINRAKVNHRILCAWVDVFDEHNKRTVVFHECYVNTVGHVNR